MLKLIRLSAALSVAAVIVSIPQTVFSRPVSQTSGYPIVRNPGADSPFCFMRTSQGATVDLENLCTADDGSGSGNAAGNIAATPAAAPPPNQAPSNATTVRGGVVSSTTPSGEAATPIGANPSPNNNPGGTNLDANNNPGGTNTSPNNNANTTNNNLNGTTGGTNTSPNNNANTTNGNLNNQL